MLKTWNIDMNVPYLETKAGPSNMCRASGTHVKTLHCKQVSLMKRVPLMIEKNHPINIRHRSSCVKNLLLLELICNSHEVICKELIQKCHIPQMIEGPHLVERKLLLHQSTTANFLNCNTIQIFANRFTETMR